VPDILIYILAALSVLVLIFIFLGREQYPYFARETLMTRAELTFFHALSTVIDKGLIIAPKVRLADVINCTEKNWALGYGPKISSKHIDFVLAEKFSGKILLCIELDDKSHLKPDRQRRDQFVNKALAAAQIPFLRVPVTRSYPLQDLRNLIEAALITEKEFHKTSMLKA
jgi:hypothetical protein